MAPPICRSARPIFSSGARMRSGIIAASLAVFTFATASAQGRGGGRGTAINIKAGEQCPAGMTEIRPRQCMPPEFPAPSIVDYRPKSTLVTPVNMKPTPKYPAIDYHGHAAGRLNTAEGIEGLGAALDSIGVRIFVAADNMSGDNLR